MTGVTPNASPPTITRVRIKGFRSIADCDVRLGSLNVLVGFNAAGKSSFLDALRFVAEAITTTPARAVSDRGGLERILCHVPEAGVQASAFRIHLDLNFGPANEHATTADYMFEIGMDAEDGALPSVLREECILTEPDGTRVEFPARTDRSSRDRLVLPLLGLAAPHFRELESHLQSMRFYELSSKVLRAIDDGTQSNTELGPRGEHLGNVLGVMAATAPAVKEHVDGYLRAVVPQLLGVDERREGEFSTVRARFWTGDPVVPYWNAVNEGAVTEGDPHVEVFQRQELSEGTLRAAGVLAALFQPGTFDGSIPLIGIEEPETAIHPAKVAALFEAMLETSARTQVITTTQSSDLLEAAGVRAEHILLVEMAGGLTRIQRLGEQPGHAPMVAALHRQGLLRGSEQ